ncbi:hypothetical protein DFR70_10632 [Nocardia tenerifensis]|uniref:Uncharacterized protein n=1 Tax=Nocardia tenerifensis TaxID=228006 RepID=A0A318JYB6_9NOCA|nr:hypothetical protein DFR70_10632 [Nocardia tenerifensis]
MRHDKISNNQSRNGGGAVAPARSIQHRDRNFEKGCDLRLTDGSAGAEGHEIDTAASFPQTGHTGTTRRKVHVETPGPRLGRRLPPRFATVDCAQALFVHRLVVGISPPLWTEPAHVVHDHAATDRPDRCPHPRIAASSTKVTPVHHLSHTVLPSLRTVIHSHQPGASEPIAPQRSSSDRQSEGERRPAIPKQHTASSTGSRGCSRRPPAAISRRQSGETAMRVRRSSSSSTQVYPQVERRANRRAESR